MVSQDANYIICDSCGATQPLFEALSGEDVSICLEGSISKQALQTYRTALSKMEDATTESEYTACAEMFDDITGVLNAEQLELECRKKGLELVYEEVYQNALVLMQMEDPECIRNSIQAFAFLENYKDAPAKHDECVRKLSEIQARVEAKQAREHRLERRKARKQKYKQVWKRVAIISVICFVLAAIAFRFWLYSASHIEITFTPQSEEYITSEYNKYIFNYDVVIKNTGLLDVESIQGDIIFENANGEALVDTGFSFYNSSGAAVRAHKSSRYTWHLSAPFGTITDELRQTDFEDLKVIVKITQITYKNGKTKTY